MLEDIVQSAESRQAGIDSYTIQYPLYLPSKTGLVSTVCIVSAGKHCSVSLPRNLCKLECGFKCCTSDVEIDIFESLRSSSLARDVSVTPTHCLSTWFAFDARFLVKGPDCHVIRKF